MQFRSYLFFEKPSNYKNNAKRYRSEYHNVFNAFDHFQTAFHEIAQKEKAERPEERARDVVIHKRGERHVPSAGDEGDERAQGADESPEKHAFPAVLLAKPLGFFKIFSFERVFVFVFNVN